MSDKSDKKDDTSLILRLRVDFPKKDQVIKLPADTTLLTLKMKTAELIGASKVSEDAVLSRYDYQMAKFGEDVVDLNGDESLLTALGVESYCSVFARVPEDIRQRLDKPKPKPKPKVKLSKNGQLVKDMLPQVDDYDIEEELKRNAHDVQKTIEHFFSEQAKFNKYQAKPLKPSKDLVRQIREMFPQFEEELVSDFLIKNNVDRCIEALFRYSEPPSRSQVEELRAMFPAHSDDELRHALVTKLKKVDQAIDYLFAHPPKPKPKKTEEVKKEEPKKDDKKEEQPKKDEPKPDDSKKDEPKPDDKDKDKDKKADEPKKDEPPKTEEPKKDEPKKEEPKKDDKKYTPATKKEDPKITSLREMFPAIDADTIGAVLAANSNSVDKAMEQLFNYKPPKDSGSKPSDKKTESKQQKDDQPDEKQKNLKVSGCALPLEYGVVLYKAVLTADEQLELLKEVLALDEEHVDAAGRLKASSGKGGKPLTVLHSNWQGTGKSNIGSTTALYDKARELFWRATGKNGSTPNTEDKFYNFHADAVSVLLYPPNGHLPTHRDAKPGWVLGVSLGSTATFYFQDKSTSRKEEVALESGDVIVYNATKLLHGVDKIATDAQSPSFWKKEAAEGGLVHGFDRFVLQFRDGTVTEPTKKSDKPESR